MERVSHKTQLFPSQPTIGGRRRSASANASHRESPNPTLQAEQLVPALPRGRGGSPYTVVVADMGTELAIKRKIVARKEIRVCGLQH